MSIGKIKMKGTKPVMEVTKQPRDTGEFEKVEIPNPTVSKSISKVEAKYPTFYSDKGGYHISTNKDAPDVSGKDLDRYNHWKRHTVNTEIYSMAHRGGDDKLNILNGEGLEPGYAHYKENVDADKQLYDYLMGVTGGNGEKKK